MTWDLLTLTFLPGCRTLSQNFRKKMKNSARKDLFYQLLTPPTFHSILFCMEFCHMFEKLFCYVTINLLQPMHLFWSYQILYGTNKYKFCGSMWSVLKQKIIVFCTQLQLESPLVSASVSMNISKKVESSVPRNSLLQL